MTLPYRAGDTIGLPPEPPVGTVLHAEDGVGGFEVERGPEGWLARHLGEHGPRWLWATLFREYGANPEAPLRVISLPPPPPSTPRKCTECATSYDRCTLRIRNEGRPCCAACYNTATHSQHAWERAYGSALTSEVVDGRRVTSEVDTP